MPTYLAKPQMDPSIAYFQAIFTASRTWGDNLDLVKMRTLCGHIILLLLNQQGPQDSYLTVTVTQAIQRLRFSRLT
jgi:hypothetical protein